MKQVDSGGQRTRYSQLSSVAWVNRYWVIGVFCLAAAINLMSAIRDGQNASDKELPVFWPMFVCILALAVVISYPYYHYRMSGGYIKRIPPRFVQEKPVFVQMYQ